MTLTTLHRSNQRRTAQSITVLLVPYRAVPQERKRKHVQDFIDRFRH